jgi:putative DNA primase/helicase
MGKQGIRKSTAFRVLAVRDEWFADTLSELGSKDSRVEISGKWLTEMSELDRVKGRALETVKSFLTTRHDHYRPPYGRRAEDVPRQCVFVGTTNSETPLADESGNRRFWPITCGEIDIDGLLKHRDQLWAEAVSRYRAGAKWYLDSKELQDAAVVEQAKRYEGGVWDESILEWLDDPKQAERYEPDAKTSLPIEPFESSPNSVTLRDILLHCIKKPLSSHTQADRNTVARCLISAGYSRKQKRGKGWFYEK